MVLEPLCENSMSGIAQRWRRRSPHGAPRTNKQTRSVYQTKEARSSRSGGWRRHEPPAADRQADAEVDAILDKISREGMQSLTEDEMKTLRERSQLGP